MICMLCKQLREKYRQHKIIQLASLGQGQAKLDTNNLEKHLTSTQSKSQRTLNMSKVIDLTKRR